MTQTYPPLPKSLAETHEVLPKMNIQTNKFEDFLQINDIEKGMIMFTCQKNLECLSDVSELYMDGTYSVVRNSLSNCIPFMVYEMDIMFHLYLYCYQESQNVSIITV